MEIKRRVTLEEARDIQKRGGEILWRPEGDEESALVLFEADGVMGEG